MLRRQVLKYLGLAALAVCAAGPALAQNTVTIVLVLPSTGPFGPKTGHQINNAIKAYMAQNGDTVAGKKNEIILKDDASVADTTKRLVQELVVNDKVNIIAGFGLTPL